jgi:hypothetical protein
MERGYSNKLDGTVQGISKTSTAQVISYPANPLVIMTKMNMINHDHGRGFPGKVATIVNPTKTKKTLNQKAINQGLRGLSPRDHLPANQLPMIWNGKSTKTATAKSSLASPFSTNLSEVTVSWVTQATFATK